MLYRSKDRICFFIIAFLFFYLSSFPLLLCSHFLIFISFCLELLIFYFKLSFVLQFPQAHLKLVICLWFKLIINCTQKIYSASRKALPKHHVTFNSILQEFLSACQTSTYFLQKSNKLLFFAVSKYYQSHFGNL